MFLIFENLFYLLLDAQSKTSKHAIGFVAHCIYVQWKSRAEQKEQALNAENMRVQ